MTKLAFRRTRRMITSAAAAGLLVGCESAATNAPAPEPSPALQSAQAAAALGLDTSRGLAAAQGALAARVEGWEAPARTAAPGAPGELSEADRAAVAARATQLEAQIRARAADRTSAPAVGPR